MAFTVFTPTLAAVATALRPISRYPDALGRPVAVERELCPAVYGYGVPNTSEEVLVGTFVPPIVGFVPRS